MARPLRVEYAGAFYHVINRGNAGENIFKSKKDREKFLGYLKKAIERFSIRIHTYCLMSNHFHLLLETTKPNLSKTIQWLNISYAVYFNRKHQRSGHLFQGRFKAILVDQDEYLKQLSRYIHLNPMRARMVEDTADYPWSSYKEFIGRTKATSWLETGFLLSQFGRNKKDARQNYKQFVEDVGFDTLENPHKNLSGGFILGPVDFVQWIKETYLSPRSDEKEIPQLKKLKPSIEVERVVDLVVDEFACSRNKILSKGRKKNTARDMAIYLARDLTSESGVNLGAYFGNISGAGITLRYNHFLKELTRNQRLQDKVNKLKRRIINF